MKCYSGSLKIKKLAVCVCVCTTVKTSCIPFLINGGWYYTIRIFSDLRCLKTKQKPITMAVPVFTRHASQKCLAVWAMLVQVLIISPFLNINQLEYKASRETWRFSWLEFVNRVLERARAIFPLGTNIKLSGLKLSGHTSVASVSAFMRDLYHSSFMDSSL